MRPYFEKMAPLGRELRENEGKEAEENVRLIGEEEKKVEEAIESVRNAVDEAEIEAVLAEVSMIPQTTVKLDGKEAVQLLKIMEGLEEHDDVQNVYSNFDIPDDMIEQAA